MRTTVDLPDDLLRAAKSLAAERGESLKDLFARAVAHEIGLRAGPRGVGKVLLPLVGRASTPTVRVTNSDIEEALVAEDAGTYDGR